MELDEIMTIEEAIKHADEVAESCALKELRLDADVDTSYLTKCAAEHRQLSAWLKELLEYKSQPKIIYCKDCKKRNFAGYCTVHQKNVHGLAAEFWRPEDNYFCADGEKINEQTY